ncbi:MAG: hypothetical protein P9X24_16180 [Candidatus Hatepunaea meridiana]|nr:hypothetical protein [Candidatus Hatepunaea meridiana]
MFCNRIITIDEEEPESESDELKDAGARTASYLQNDVEEVTDTPGRLEQLRDYLWNKAMTGDIAAATEYRMLEVTMIDLYHKGLLKPMNRFTGKGMIKVMGAPRRLKTDERDEENVGGFPVNHLISFEPNSFQYFEPTRMLYHQ